MRDADGRYLKNCRFPNHVESAVEKSHRLSAEGAVSREPGASPREIESSCKQALKVRFQRAGGLKRAFSAGSLVTMNVAAATCDDRAPLALIRRYRQTPLLVFAKT